MAQYNNAVDDIIDYFDVEEMQDLINESVLSDEITSMVQMDAFKQMWARYQSLTQVDKSIVDSDTMEECTRRFGMICQMYFNAICKKYSISVDEGWYDELNNMDRFAISVSMYTMFIVDIEQLLVEIFIKYIEKYNEQLAEQFAQDTKLRKDATYFALKETVEHNYAVIIASIYEIAYTILDSLGQNDFFEYIDNDYMPKDILFSHFEDSHLSGEFMDALYEIFKISKNNLARICFDIITNIKENHAISQNDN